jgi:osmotically-inducible protein OsmY
MIKLGFLLLVIQVALAACTPLGAVIGAGATAGTAAVQERGAMQVARDTGTQLAINRALLERNAALFRRVSTIVIEGRVLLTGVVLTQEDRDTATQVAYSVDSVREVINELMIGDESAMETLVSDTRITAALRSRILGDGKIVDINYNIDTVRGVVYLMGIAQDEAELERVISYARGIGGVRRLVNHAIRKDDPRRARN